MFSKHHKKEPHLANNSEAQNARPERSDVPSIIASDLKILGNLISNGAVEIEGDVEGNITCEQITIRQKGRVKGDIVAQTIQIDGEAEGLVKGRSVLVSEGGKISGIVIYESLSVQDGAAINGQCKYVTSIQETIEHEGASRRLLEVEPSLEKQEA